MQLRHIPTGVVVKSQATRSRDQNRKHAREILAQRLDELQNGDHSRTALVADIKRKRASSADKKKRRKYKLLDEVKSAASSSDADAGVVEQAPAETRSEVQAQLQADDVSEQPKCEPGQLGSTVNPEVNTKR